MQKLLLEAKLGGYTNRELHYIGNVSFRTRCFLN